MSEVRTPMHVLLAEADSDFGRAAEASLSAAGANVHLTRSGIDAYSALQLRSYDALVLDLALPDLSGFEILQRLRANDSRVPVVIVSTQNLVEDRIRGLELGADDYLHKPYETAELLARLRALVRRASPKPGMSLTAGDIEIDLLGRTATLRRIPVPLTPREFEVLRLLIESPGTVSRAQIIAKLRGQAEPLNDNVAIACIHALRKKFGRDPIHTYRGWGYLIRR